MQNDGKMSSSDEHATIFTTDDAKTIKNKINKAYCPEKEIFENPIADYAQHLLFPKFKTLKVERPTKFGGDIELESFADLENIYGKGELHPMDLKNTVANYTNKLIAPVREHFEKNVKAKELLEQVNSFSVTR